MMRTAPLMTHGIEGLEAFAFVRWSAQLSAIEHSRIALAPDVLAGKPVIRGTRIAVQFVIGLMADGWSEADILENYPGVTHDDIIACLAYARDTLSSERVFPSAA